MLTRYAIMSITIISLFVTLPSVFSQKTAQIKSLLSDFKSFKYSNIYLYRIDSSKGLVKGNLQVISMRANKMKNKATENELLQFAINALKMFENGL